MQKNTKTIKTENLRVLLKEYVLNKQQEIIIGKYKFIKFIGKGAYGQVYKAVHQTSKKVYAIKLCDKSQIKRKAQSQYVRQKQMKLLKTEGILMQKCDSQHVIKCHEIIENDLYKLFVMEYCSGGTLSDQLKRRTVIPQQQAIKILKQLILGLKQLHRNKIIHRDLKADNIILHQGSYKICDFGFCKELNHHDQVDFFTQLGTYATMAPEVRKNQPYGLKADIWSLGIIFYTMICKSYTIEQRYEHAARRDFFFLNAFDQTPSSKTVGFLRDLLRDNHHQRLSWSQMLQHPIFKESNELDGGYVRNQRIRQQKNVENNKKQIEQKQKKNDLQVENILENQKKIQESQYQSLTNENNEQEQMELQPKKSQTTDVKQQIDINDIINRENNNDKKRAQSVTIISEVNTQQEQSSKLFEEIKQNYFECLKSQYIYKQIIFPIQNYKLLDTNCTKVAQMMCLLIYRCFLNVSWFKMQINRNENSKNQNSRKILVDYRNQLTPLYQKITQMKQIIQQRLQTKQGQIKNKLKNYFSSVFHRKKSFQKQIMLSGIQKIDYEKFYQIQYTHSNYIMDLANQLESKNDKGRTVAVRLRAYKAINEITLQSTEKIPFKIKVQNIINFI